MTSWHRPVHSLFIDCGPVGLHYRLWASRPTLTLIVRHHEWVAWGRWLMLCGRDTHLADICTHWAPSSYSVPTIAMSMSVCPSVHSHRPNSKTTLHGRTSPNFSRMLPMAVTRSSSGCVALRYVMYFRSCGWRHVSTYGLYGASCVFLSCESVIAKLLIDSSQILLSDKQQQVHIMSCTVGRSLPSKNALLGLTWENGKRCRARRI